MENKKFYIVYEVPFKDSISENSPEYLFRIGIFRSKKAAENFSKKRDVFGTKLDLDPNCYVKEEKFTESEAQEISDFCIIASAETN